MDGALIFHGVITKLDIALTQSITFKVTSRNFAD